MQQAFEYIQTSLGGQYSPSEIRPVSFLLIEKLTGFSRTQILADKSTIFSPEQRKELAGFVEKLKKNMPLQYVLGETEFCGLIFKLNESVLIPRPETEELVEWICAENRAGRRLKILDIGTGSGCIAVALKHKIPDAAISAVDISDEALSAARHNAEINKTDIHFSRQDILQAYETPAKWDIIVSNPPYSTQWAGNDNPLLINDLRFSPAGILAPKSKADLAFVMHILAWLAINGTAAIVEFPGVLYRSGAEQKIRKYLIDNNYIDCVIQLPANLFFGVSIATCIIVLKQSKTDNTTLFIDASKESVHYGNKEKLTDKNIDKILNAYIERNNKEYFTRLVPNAEIADNDYNIAVSSYVEQEDTREVIDIVQLNAKIAEIVKRENELRQAIDEIINDLEGDGYE